MPNEIEWDPNDYGAFAAERRRACLDLVARIDVREPRVIVDLGCGAGVSTRVLAERWPKAEIVAVDSSPKMLDRARRQMPSVRFDCKNIADWKPERQFDVIVSNAALHWLPDNAKLIRKLATYLTIRGTLAIQLADRSWFSTPAQKAIDDALSDPRWSNVLSSVGLRRESVRPLERYVRLLRELGCEVDAWQTRYLHLLRGDDAVFAWLKGSVLRPHLSALDPSRSERFSDAVKERLRRAYPQEDGVTLFRVPRQFLVARARGLDPLRE